MIRFLSPFLLVFITIYCSENPNRIENKTTETNNNLSTDTYSYKAIKNESGWGYLILNFDKTYINQPHIPAVNGLQTFRSEAEAQKVAAYIVKKLNNGIFPPTISRAELDSLYIYYVP